MATAENFVQFCESTAVAVEAHVRRARTASAEERLHNLELLRGSLPEIENLAGRCMGRPEAFNVMRRLERLLPQIRELMSEDPPASTDDPVPPEVAAAHEQMTAATMRLVRLFTKAELAIARARETGATVAEDGIEATVGWCDQWDQVYSVLEKLAPGLYA